MTPIRLLHFADAHIDIATYGRHDPETGLPIRVVDFLSALDVIVDRAIADRVDLVVFAGDAYKDRNPQPTFQRAWGERIMRLSQAGIPTVLLVGNHDVARATGRAHTLQEFRTLGVPDVHVADKIGIFGPDELGLPLQIITLPWVSRHALMTREETHGKGIEAVYQEIEDRVSTAVRQLIDRADPDLPLLLTAHASIEGAKFGSERTVSLGHELVLSQGLVRDKRLDYVALGHIHKHQNLNPSNNPPVVYPGSIERIDFGEVRENKGYVLAEIDADGTRWEFVELNIRPFHDIKIDTPNFDTFMADILKQLPEPDEVVDAVCRVQLTYPRDWEELLDEKAIAQVFDQALSFQLLKHRHTNRRSRLGDIAAVDKMSPLELLETYWRTQDLEDEEVEVMQSLAKEVFEDVEEV